MGSKATDACRTRALGAGGLGPHRACGARAAGHASMGP
jgi:hypothetical protein